MSSESDDEDNLVTYGTPLEPLEEDEIPTKKPCQLEDQIVTDAQGRRRFHGAFTGGFSAGFFNTVGSLEGWKPSSFKSTKSEGRKTIQQKPEDFMDEEDFGEFGIAPVILKAKRDYTNKEKKENFVFNQSLGNFVLKDLLRPVRESVGIKLLKKMGWKPGQGVGPRITSSEKKKITKIREKIYGCQLPQDCVQNKDDSDSNSDSEWTYLKFAPSDYEQVFNRKQDSVCGLGYSGLDKKPILGSSIQSKLFNNVSNPKKNYSSQAFGVGVFEEEDEDIYSKEDMSSYDFTLGGSSKQQCESISNALLPALGLEGFVLELQRMVKKHYPLPALPKNFTPRHTIQCSTNTVVKTKSSRWSDIDSTKTAPLTSQKSAEDTLDMVKIREQNKISTEELISKVSIKPSHFKPFASNEDKQKRYEQYLKLVEIKRTDCLENLQPLSMSRGEREREKVEFAKAAALFKPLTGGMEDRFSTASQPDDISNPLAPVERLHDEHNSQKKAAKMKMYGKLTRETKEWMPCSLLCKRFNIPDPQKSSSSTAEKKYSKPVHNLFKALEAQENDLTKNTSDGDNSNKVKEKQTEEATQETKQETQSLPNSDTPNLEIKKTQTFDSTEKILTTSSNKIDLFKEIFLSDEEEEPEKETSPVEQKKEINVLSFEEKIVNSKRNTSPPKGIFQNIDLDSLKERITFGVRRKDGEEPCQEKKDVADDNVYGPKLPEKFVAKTIFSVPQKVLSDGVWVEKTSHHKKKKKKKEKEKSKKKSKHKHKKKY